MSYANFTWKNILGCLKFAVNYHSETHDSGRIETQVKLAITGLLVLIRLYMKVWLHVWEGPSSSSRFKEFMFCLQSRTAKWLGSYWVNKYAVNKWQILTLRIIKFGRYFKVTKKITAMLVDKSFLLSTSLEWCLHVFLEVLHDIKAQFRPVALHTRQYEPRASSAQPSIVM